MASLILFQSRTSVCSQKVRLVLAEKELPYRSVFLDLAKGEQFSNSYRKLNPDCRVPTLKSAGKVICESNTINLHLEGLNLGSTLLPEAKIAHSQCKKWMAHSLQFHRAINTITQLAMKARKLRELAPREIERRLAEIPFTDRRQKLANLVTHGHEAQEFVEALCIVPDLLEGMEQTLQQSTFLAGAQPTLADFSIFPFLYRLEILTFDILFQDHSMVRNWYKNMKSRPSARKAVTAFHSDEVIEKYGVMGSALWRAARL